MQALSDGDIPQPAPALKQKCCKDEGDYYHDDPAGVFIAVPMATCEEEVHIRRYEGDEGDQQAGEAGAASLARHHRHDAPGVGHSGDNVDGPQHEGVATKSWGESRWQCP